MRARSRHRGPRNPCDEHPLSAQIDASQHLASGDVRKDIDPSDLLRALVGVSYGNPDAGWEASARRLVDILMDGLRRNVKP
jgi:hypothetical protein